MYASIYTTAAFIQFWGTSIICKILFWRTSIKYNDIYIISLYIVSLKGIASWLTPCTIHPFTICTSELSLDKSDMEVLSTPHLLVDIVQGEKCPSGQLEKIYQTTLKHEHPCIKHAVNQSLSVWYDLLNQARICSGYVIVTQNLANAEAVNSMLKYLKLQNLTAACICVQTCYLYRFTQTSLVIWLIIELYLSVFRLIQYVKMWFGTIFWKKWIPHANIKLPLYPVNDYSWEYFFKALNCWWWG